MDPNIEMIYKITSSTHTSKVLKSFSSYFASDFTYKDSFRRALDFEEHCMYMEMIKQNCEFEIVSIIDINCCYEMKLDITIIHNDKRVRSRLTSKTRFYIEDGIIQKIRASYSLTPMQMLYYLKNTKLFNGK